MEYEDKIELMTHIFECIEEAMEVDSDDCEKEDICEGLLTLLFKNLILNKIYFLNGRSI